jgi:hypothetical protein
VLPATSVKERLDVTTKAPRHQGFYVGLGAFVVMTETTYRLIAGK